MQKASLRDILGDESELVDKVLESRKEVSLLTNIKLTYHMFFFNRPMLPTPTCPPVDKLLTYTLAPSQSQKMNVDNVAEKVLKPTNGFSDENSIRTFYFPRECILWK